jgi:hypothetical protein
MRKLFFAGLFFFAYTVTTVAADAPTIGNWTCFENKDALTDKESRHCATGDVDGFLALRSDGMLVVAISDVMDRYDDIVRVRYSLDGGDVEVARLSLFGNSGTMAFGKIWKGISDAKKIVIRVPRAFDTYHDVVLLPEETAKVMEWLGL